MITRRRVLKNLYEIEPMYIEVLEDGLLFSKTINPVYYSTNEGLTWTSLGSWITSPSFSTGTIIHLYAVNNTINSTSGIGTFTITKKCNIGGNIMSLYSGLKKLTKLSSNAFSRLFYNCVNIINISEDFLPITNLSDSCYYLMFKGCTSLKTPPQLPATTLTSMCYREMFYGCTSLINAPKMSAKILDTWCCLNMFYNCSALKTTPELPATTLTDLCYSGMFNGCKSLTKAPKLPATTLAKSCYSYMFSGCTSLTVAPELPAMTLAFDCYGSMFSSCSSLTTAPKLPATSLVSYCYNGMFNYCTSLTTAPELPATTLTEHCYDGMFYRCSSLTTAPELPAMTLALDCYRSMFSSCSSLTTAPELPAMTLVDYCYRYMFKSCKKLNYIKMLATDISANDCLFEWVNYVSSTGTFVKNPSVNLPSGISGIPEGWIVEFDFTPTECISLTITADDVRSEATFTTIYYTAICNGVDSNGNVVTGVEMTGQVTSEEFPLNTSTTDTIERTVSFTYLGATATTTIILDVYVNSYYTVNLNSNWLKSTTIANPDSSLYDGVYESYSNKGVNSTAAIMYIDIDGYENFTLYIRSNAETSYDYIMVSQLDQTITNSTSYSNTTLVKAHTRGNRQAGTKLSNYTEVNFTGIDEGAHRIPVLFRKDGSGNSYDDRGYILIPINQ